MTKRPVPARECAGKGVDRFSAKAVAGRSAPRVASERLHVLTRFPSTFPKVRERPDMTLDEAVILLRRHYQHGLFDNVRAVADAVLAAAPEHALARRYRDYVDRPPAAERPPTVTVIWQVDDTAREWSGEWVRFLLGGLPVREVVDGRHAVIADRAVVVDQKLGPAASAYAREAFRRGFRFGFLHLSDEGYADDLAAYGYCDFVIRNYWSPFLDGNPRVLTVPLGHRSGAGRGDDRPAAERPYLWSFAGDPGKSSRPRMLEALDGLGPRRLHLTTSFFDPTALDPAAYRALLADSVFAPCPCGFINLDSFRVYEALECGCIPIVERRPGFDYFAALFGDHPMPTVGDWSEAPPLLSALAADPDGLERRRAACVSWWRRTRTEARDAVTRLVLDHTGTAPLRPYVPCLW